MSWAGGVSGAVDDDHDVSALFGDTGIPLTHSHAQLKIQDELSKSSIRPPKGTFIFGLEWYGTVQYSTVQCCIDCPVRALFNARLGVTVGIVIYPPNGLWRHRVSEAWMSG
jgi:hypothetical protein